MFPEELPRRLIKMFSFVGDTVLDPFLGSGTACLAAKNLERNSIGYEINKEFLPIIKLKLKTVDIEIVYQEKLKINFREEIKKLPYIFKDPVKFDKKVDPKKLRYGSRIDQSDYSRETYHTVKEIINPEVLVLDNGLKIRLIGVKEKREANGEAVKFLAGKLKGEKVFMKYDSIKYDKNGHLLCYLYLRNKTFINAHLIKNNLAEVDTSLDYRYKSKFLSFRRQPNAKRMDN
jgi:site-specific DNA-methyltransferase (adenine-specific)